MQELDPLTVAVDAVPATALTQRSDAPVGVFDSGIGGISVLRVLHRWLPHENWVYFADSAHAPYGEKSIEYVIARAQAITAELIAKHGIKALVVACNTATAEAIHILRDQYPDLPIVGIEPGIKPALALSQTRKIGIMATRRTVSSLKFQRLLQSVADQAEFVVRACDGLALAIERQDVASIHSLLTSHTQAMGHFGHHAGEIDTLVLGCTHYPLVSPELKQVIGQGVALVDPGEGIAKQLERLLNKHHLLSRLPHSGLITCQSSAKTAPVEAAMQRWCSSATQHDLSGVAG
jgi:glutamate racemase